jgi:putative inorganic carbon (HCO3(-)) transporter
MFSSTHPIVSLSRPAGLHRTRSTLLVIAAMGVAFQWCSGHDEQRCVQLVLLALLAVFLLVRSEAAQFIAGLGRTTCLCLGAFFILGAASALTAVSLRHAAFEWSILLLLLLAAVLLAAELARAGKEGLQTVLHCMGAICILYSLRVLLMYAAALSSGVQIGMHVLAVGFSNVRFLNHTQTALLPLIVLLSLQAPKATAMRRVWFALAAFWWALLFVSEARATILALGAGCAAGLLARRSHARAFIQMMVLTAIAGALVYVLGFILLPMLAGMQPIGLPSNVVARTAADPSSGRTLLWKLVLQLIAAHPWLGVGPHHFAHEGAKLGIGAHPHDWLFQIAVEWGLPALMCLLGAVALGARALVRSGKRIGEGDLHNQQILMALLTACAAIFVDGLFSGVLVMPQSQLAIVLVIGCAGGWVRSLDAGAAAAAPGWSTRTIIAVLTATALCGLVWSVAPDFMRHARGEAPTPAEQAINAKAHWPRLWETGYF